MRSTTDAEKIANIIVGKLEEYAVEKTANFLHENYHLMLSTGQWWFFDIKSQISLFFKEMEADPIYWRYVAGTLYSPDDLNYSDLLEAYCKCFARRLQNYANGRQINYTITIGGDTGFRYE